MLASSSFPRISSGVRRHDEAGRIRRRVHADDTADLGAPLSYSVEILAGDDDGQDLDPAAAAPVQVPPVGPDRSARRRGPPDGQAARDRLAQAGHPLKPRTIQTAL